MLLNYLNYYLIFIIISSVLLSFIILRLRFSAPRIVIPIIIAILLLPGVAGYIYFTYFSSIPEIVVPDLKGRMLDKALEELGSLDLKGRHAGEVYDMQLPEGHVVSQRPEAGRKVKAGRVVSLLTSSGKRRVLVPHLLGRPAVQAEAVLAAKGLVLGKIEEDFVPGLDAGIILTQHPLPGEEVDVGYFVNLTISTTVEPMVLVEAGSGEGEGKGVDKEEGGFRFLWW